VVQYDVAVAKVALKRDGDTKSDGWWVWWALPETMYCEDQRHVALVCLLQAIAGASHTRRGRG
jgi:hypothetical protein